MLTIDKTELLKTYWGEHLPSPIWGWKDPRNSATALIWREVFPEMRVLTVSQQWKPELKSKEGSKAGEWFRGQSSQTIREMYTSPPGIEGLDMHRVDFDLLLSDEAELQKLLLWAGLPLEPVESFDAFLIQVGVESL